VNSRQPFWRIKKLENFSEEEWEQVCCRCGLCCLIKLQDDVTEEVFYTKIICHLFDKKQRVCTEYENRCRLVPQCLKLSLQNIDKLAWMPKKCAYRILFETGDLPDWHPLKNKAEIPDLPKGLVSDMEVDEQEWEDYIVEDEDF